MPLLLAPLRRAPLRPVGGMPLDVVCWLRRPPVRGPGVAAVARAARAFPARLRGPVSREAFRDPRRCGSFQGRLAWRIDAGRETLLLRC